MIRFLIRHPHLVLVFALVLLVLGIVAFRQLPADLLPVFETPAVQIVTFYPGMPPEVMERDIMSRMQRWTGQSIGIEHQEGKAMLGVCVVKDFFREDVSLDTAMSQVTSYAMSDLFYLPPGTIPPMVMPFDPTAAIPLCLVAVSSPTMNEQALYDLAYFELRNRLQSIRGVIAPAVYGGVLRRILAYVDRDRLEARDLSLVDVARSLRESNVFIPAGNAKIGPYDWQILTNGMPSHVTEINDMPLRTADGSPILMSDVGDVRDSHQIQTNIVRINGRRQVYVPIYRQPGANTLEIVAAIRGELRSILERLREMDPRAKDMRVDLAMDQSSTVRRSIDGLLLSAALGAILAGVVVAIFLRDLRATLAVFVTIPLAMLGAFLGLRAMGATINAMTLGGLALAIGILVDQAIVVLENTMRHLRAGLCPVDAAATGAKEVALPILVSTITFMIVFLPVVFLSGMARYLFTPLAVAATFAIVASFLLSMSLVPVFCGRFLRVRATGAEAIGGTRRVRRAVDLSLRMRRLVLPVAAAGTALAAMSVLRGPTELFPQVDSRQFTAHIRLRSGTRIEETERVIAEIESAIAAEIGEPDPAFPETEAHPGSELKLMVSNIGVLLDWPAAYTPNTGPMDAFLLVELKNRPGASSTLDIVERLRRTLAARFPDVEFAFDAGGLLTGALNFGEPSPIHFQVSGSSLETARRIAEAVREEALGVPGAVDARIAQRLDYPVIRVDVDRHAAMDLGVTAAAVVRNLVAATNSSVNFDPAFWIDERNGNHYFLGVQYDEKAVDSVDALLDIPVGPARDGGTVPLCRVATIRRDNAPSVVNHHNITRVTDIFVNVARGHDVGSVTAAIEARVGRRQDLGLLRREGSRGAFLEVGGRDFAGKGYRIELRGEMRTMRESFAAFGTGLVIAALLVFLVMVPQFRSFLLPLVVMTCVLFALIGIAAALRITGTAFSIPVFMGVIMTVGIVVEYAILLVDFARRREAEGATPREAVLDAAEARFRPILMTSLTTWVALVPMAIGGVGSESSAPLARTIIGGVLAATVLTLFVVPGLYVAVRGRRSSRGGASQIVVP